MKIDDNLDKCHGLLNSMKRKQARHQLMKDLELQLVYLDRCEVDLNKALNDEDIDDDVDVSGGASGSDGGDGDKMEVV